MNFLKTHTKSIVVIVLSSIAYVMFAYQLQRTDALLLLGLYTVLFVCFWQLLQLKNYKLLIGLGVLFRVLFLFAIPNLSQDFYRFIWDGQMTLISLNPYLSTPNEQMDLGILSGFPNQIELYNGMGKLNASHYTNYPPINQLLFILGNLFPGKSILSSVIGIRLIIILADIGIVYFGSRLLEKLKLPKHRVFWYFLNPFIIIELTGNLHFEAVMLFFLIWSLYLLQQGKWQWAAVIFGLSVSTKLMPLLFLPLVWQWFISTTLNDRISNRFGYSLRQTKHKANRPEVSNKKTSQILKTCEVSDKQNEMLKQSRKFSGQHDKTRVKKKQSKEKWIPAYSSTSLSDHVGMTRLILFYIIVGTIVLLTFLPFYDSQFITNYNNTVALWFNKFEFNASIYYIAREIGYLFRGYNEIAIIGKVLSVITFLFVVGVAFFRNNKTMPQLLSAMLICFAFYLFFSTTVHPWYLATLVLLCLFTNYRFPMVWSFVIILSYLAYLQIGNADKSENLWIITIEYLIVFIFLLFDLFRLRIISNKHNSKLKFK